MKKTISIIAAFMLVFAFAGVASAEIEICSEAGTIARGCEQVGDEQGGVCTTSPFDYEDFFKPTLDEDYSCFKSQDSYCEIPVKGDRHRALFKICDCITEGQFEGVNTDDTIDIGMEILVDKHDGNGPVDGDNGVYWAQDVNTTGVGVETFETEGAACDAEQCLPDDDFIGDFDLFLANGKTSVVIDGTDTDAATYSGSDCEVADNERVVAFRAAADQDADAHGYVVQPDDATDNKSVWWVDIPELRADSSITDDTGWDVYVEICMYTTVDDGGVCGECDGCCYQILIGTLCCDTPQGSGDCTDTLTFPYIPNPAGNYWFGMAVTNLDSIDGSASVTLYEEDGDVATGTVTLEGNVPTIVDLSTLTLTTSVDGTLGNAKAYAVVVANVSASGFGFMANSSNGASMGYLAEKCAECTECD